jgi:hypothetical protein
MDKNENLSNIKESNEIILNKNQPNKSDKDPAHKINTFEKCNEAVNKTVENLINNNQNLSEEVINKGNEISNNLELLLQKLEDDTNKHMQLIDSSALTEEEKKKEYEKCLQELEKISFLSQALENCIEISEDNFIKFLERPFNEDKDHLIDFLIDEEENLKKNNIYNKLSGESKYFEGLFNDSHTSYLKNYMSYSSLLKEENNIKINKVRVNENIDLGNVRELLFSMNSKNEVMQDKIESMSLKGLTKEKLNYLFNKNLIIIKKNPNQLQSMNINKKKNL